MRPLASARLGAALFALGCIVALTAAVYLKSLGDAPVNVGVDEARFAIHADSIARTGRDLNGIRLPLFFHIINPLSPKDSAATWWQPMLFYLMAGVFRVAPFTEWSVRAPIVCLAIVDVLLAYGVAHRLFGNRWYGVVAAALVALTPAHFIFARQAQDYFCMLPFALAWLWCLITYLERESAALPPAIGALLGVGLYCHISAWIVMPFYLVVTLSALWVAKKPMAASLKVAGAFAVALVPLVPWLWLHPSLPRDMMTNYQVVSAPRLADRVDIYWDYFNPSYLFFSGGSNPMFATRRAGVFPLAAAVLLPLGVARLLRPKVTIAAAVVLLGFLFAPVPIVAALPEDPRYYTPRDLLVVPFGVLIATAGVHALVCGRRRVWRLVAAILIASVPLQFAFFARHYFTEYQVWSASRFDPLNLRGVAASVIAIDEARRVPAVYLSEDISEPQAEQWVFYLRKRDRLDIWQRSRHIELGMSSANDMPSGSLLVADAYNPRLDTLVRSGSCSRVEVVNGVSGQPAAAILRRND